MESERAQVPGQDAMPFDLLPTTTASPISAVGWYQTDERLPPQYWDGTDWVAHSTVTPPVLSLGQSDVAVGASPPESSSALQAGTSQPKTPPLPLKATSDGPKSIQKVLGLVGAVLGGLVVIGILIAVTTGGDSGDTTGGDSGETSEYVGTPAYQDGYDGATELMHNIGGADIRWDANGDPPTGDAARQNAMRICGKYGSTAMLNEATRAGCIDGVIAYFDSL